MQNPLYSERALGGQGGGGDAEFHVGNVRFRNRVLLAPMSGVSDLPFRRIAWDCGAGMVFSEMVASEALAGGQFEMMLKVRAGRDLPHAVQLSGREAKWMTLATHLAEDAGAQLIDINMGCPARKVTSGYSGSALMRDLDHAQTLIEAVVSATHLPVTLKMRLGWDENTINAPELARRAENCGVQMITVHGRTRNQFYDGYAKWQRVAEVKNAVSLPVVVNGDIVDLETANQALAQSRADAVMIGRGSYGAPWMPGRIAAGFTSDDEPENLHDLIASHFEAMLGHYGTALGIRQARKHLNWYAARYRSAASREQCLPMVTGNSAAATLSAIRAVFADNSLKLAEAA